MLSLTNGRVWAETPVSRQLLSLAKTDDKAAAFLLREIIAIFERIEYTPRPNPAKDRLEGEGEGE